MSLAIDYRIFPILLAGIMNGSFVIPARYINNLTQSRMWLYYTFIALILLPVTLCYWLVPSIFYLYFHILQIPTISLPLALGGLIFGVGQICFFKAIQKVGIALSFCINLGVGVVVGSLFASFLKNTLFTLHGIIILIAILLILLGLATRYQSEKDTALSSSSHNYVKGWLLGTIAGLASGVQNIVFVLVAFHLNSATHHINPFWVWPPFLLAAGILMALVFLIQGRKKKHQPPPNLMRLTVLSRLKNVFCILLMSILFTGSLMLYSQGMWQLTPAEQTIGWPIFMAAIIITSQCWGWKSKEHGKIDQRNGYQRVVSIVLLITAVILLSMKF